MSNSSQGDLVARLRQIQDRRSPQSADRPAVPLETPQPAPRAFDFSSLDDYEQLRLHRAAADMMGLGSPFFREHQQVDGPVSHIDGRACVNFASYDYVGLNGHPEVRAAAAEAVSDWGVSATASRLVGGERPYHRALEHALADWLGTEAAIAMTSGHATNVTTIGTLMGPGDLVLADAFIHNSITEGCRLAGAQRVVFPHNDLDWLDDYLTRHRGRYRHVLIAAEGLYSMDGDAPDLAGLVRLKAQHDAWLMIDEAHALGVLGETGRGLAEQTGIDPNAVEIWMGTLSKSLAACGGFIAGSRALIDYLRYKAPGFVFSVGVAAPVAAAATKALEVLGREPERVAKLRANGAYFLKRAREAGLDCGHSQGFAVAPIITGSSLTAATASDQLFRKGINVLPIIFPAVPEKAARLRFFLTSDHDTASIDTAIDALGALE
ncbi:MAG: aminotransferase class I/II-fold pyridoxal phosphate-dependent enzyme [Pseudomonadota bacterium]